MRGVFWYVLNAALLLLVSRLLAVIGTKQAVSLFKIAFLKDSALSKREFICIIKRIYLYRVLQNGILI